MLTNAIDRKKPYGCQLPRMRLKAHGKRARLHRGIWTTLSRAGSVTAIRRAPCGPLPPTILDCVHAAELVGCRSPRHEWPPKGVQPSLFMPASGQPAVPPGRHGARPHPAPVEPRNTPASPHPTRCSNRWSGASRASKHEELEAAHPPPARERPYAAGTRRRAAADGRPAVPAVAVGRNRLPCDGVRHPLTRHVRPRSTLYSRNGNPTRLAERALLVARLTQAARFLLHVPNVMPPAMAAFAFLRRRHGWRLR